MRIGSEKHLLCQSCYRGTIHRCLIDQHGEIFRIGTTPFVPHLARGGAVPDVERGIAHCFGNTYLDMIDADTGTERGLVELNTGKVLEIRGRAVAEYRGTVTFDGAEFASLKFQGESEAESTWLVDRNGSPLPLHTGRGKISNTVTAPSGEKFANVVFQDEYPTENSRGVECVIARGAVFRDEFGDVVQHVKPLTTNTGTPKSSIPEFRSINACFRARFAESPLRSSQGDIDEHGHYDRTPGGLVISLYSLEFREIRGRIGNSWKELDGNQNIRSLLGKWLGHLGKTNG